MMSDAISQDLSRFDIKRLEAYSVGTGYIGKEFVEEPTIFVTLKKSDAQRQSRLFHILSFTNEYGFEALKRLKHCGYLSGAEYVRACWEFRKAQRRHRADLKEQSFKPTPVARTGTTGFRRVNTLH